MYKKGIDVSHYQGDIDFCKVAAAGIRYVFIKATEGGTYQDAKFAANIRGAKQSGLVAGAYHFFRALSSTPEEQRCNIISTLTGAGFDSSSDYLAIDVERTGNEGATPDQVADNLYQLLSLLGKEDALAGVRPFIYCSPSFWASYITVKKYCFSDYPLWIANWKVNEPCIPSTWSDAGKSWSAWQHSSEGKVDGIEGNVDLDWIRF